MLSRVILSVLMGLGVWIPTRASGQILDPDSLSRANIPRADAPVIQLQPAPPLLDVPINRNEYLLGPGDILDLALIGDIDELYRLTVGPEGGVVVPTVGFVMLAGVTISEAEERVRTAVSRYFRAANVSLTLAAIRSFKVFVVGDVADAGVRVATSATRVSELVRAVGGRPIPRNIVLQRSDGSELTADLARFFRTGELTENPTVRDGDVLVVPVADEFNEVVGSVAFPGMYEHRPEESLASLLGLANGGGSFPANAAPTVRVVRTVGPADRQVFEFTREEAVGPRGESFTLRAFDAILVPEIGDFMRPHTASVAGLVTNPGTYPIEPNVTTVSELIRLAGGVLPDASLRNATLRRAAEPTIAASDSAAIRAIPPEYLSNEEQRVFRARTLGDPHNVVIDLQFLETGQGGVDQALQPGDVLTIPRQRDEVAVLGAVGQPGILAHQAGWGVGEYVALAGGYSSRADRRGVTIFRGRTGAEIAPGDVDVLEPGDQIIVPFRQPVSISQRIQTAGSLASSLLAVVAAYITIRQAVD